MALLPHTLTSKFLVWTLRFLMAAGILVTLTCSAMTIVCQEKSSFCSTRPLLNLFGTFLCLFEFCWQGKSLGISELASRFRMNWDTSSSLTAMESDQPYQTLAPWGLCGSFDSCFYWLTLLSFSPAHMLLQEGKDCLQKAGRMGWCPTCGAAPSQSRPCNKLRLCHRLITVRRASLSKQTADERNKEAGRIRRLTSWHRRSRKLRFLLFHWTGTVQLYGALHPVYKSLVDFEIKRVGRIV